MGKPDRLLSMGSHRVGHDWSDLAAAVKEEMDRLLEKFNILKLNQEEVEIMNNPITSTEIEAVIKKTKAQDQITSQENSVKHLAKS